MISHPVISVEHLSKQYDLGVIGTGTLSRDINRWWARLRGQPDPYTRIGQRDHFERIGESILALDDVSFQVEQGEALGIIGKNGAGKSTLLKILSRVTAPTSGIVRIKGRVGSLLEIGTGFHPELTGRENVYLNGAILGMRKEEVDRKFDEIVDFSGVEKFIDTPVKRYSSGMYVRLAFAVAAHLDPEILIVDEVLSVGDAEFQRKCMGKMGDVSGEGRTVLFVSHNMASVEKLCPKTILINNGSIKNIGETTTIINKYLDSFTSNNNQSIYLNKYPGFKFINVLIQDEKGKERKSIVSGNDFDIVIRFSCPANLINVRVSFTIINEEKVNVAHISMDSSGQRIQPKSEGNEIICRIRRMPLPIGNYTLSVAAHDDFHGELGRIKIPDLFFVESSKFYPTTYTPSVLDSAALFDHIWII